MKRRVLIDMAVLAQAVKTGIYRVTDEIVKYLFEDDSLEVFFTLSHEEFFRGHNVDLRLGLKNYCAESGLEARFVDAEVDPAFANIDIYISTFFVVPDNWAREDRVRKVVFAYDLIALVHPEYFEEGIIKIITEFYGHIKEDWLVFAISEYTKIDLLEYRPDLNPDNVFVLYLGADDKFSAAIRKGGVDGIKIKYGIPVERPYILSLATLEIRKNLITVLEGFAEYIGSFGDSKTNLVLSGMKGWKLDQLSNEIEKRPELAGRVILTGFVDEEDLAGLYAGATVFVYMSFYEGFGLPPLEAMSAGLPVITSDTSSLPEVVGDAGIMLAPTDVKGLARALNTICSDSNARSVLGEKSRARASLFSWSKCGQQFVDAISNIELDSSPFLSIVTICYNEKAIRDTCESVVAQSYNRYQWIVIDGGSGPETIGVLEEYRRHIDVLVSEPDSGRYDAMNKGVMRSTGKYILFLNGGDYLYHKDVLKDIFCYSVPIKLFSLFSLTLKERIVYGEVVARETGLMPYTVWRTGPQNHNIEFFSGNSLPHQATFISKDLFDECGLYNTRLKFAADYEWFMRAIIRHGIKSQYLPAIVSVYNFDGVSSSSIAADAPHIVEVQSVYKHYATPNNIYSWNSGVGVRSQGRAAANDSRNPVKSLGKRFLGKQLSRPVGEEKNELKGLRVNDLSDCERSVSLALPRVSADEARDLHDLLWIAINRYRTGGYAPLSPIRFNGNSTGFNFLSTYVFRISRTLDQSKFPTDKASCVRNLLCLGERLNIYEARQPGRRHQDEVESREDMGAEVRIIRVYMSRLGRMPNRGEVKTWGAALASGLSAIEFRRQIESSQEGVQYTRLRQELEEFASALSSEAPPPVERDRYSMVQVALRNLARQRKFQGIEEGERD